MSVHQSSFAGNAYAVDRERSGGSGGRIERDESAGAWSQDLETSIYGEQEWTLPGMGDRPDSCGTWYPKQFCEECGEPHLGVSRCERRLCPDCWRRWTGKRTVNIVSRLGAARHAAEGAPGKRAVHAVASPPEGSVTAIEDVYAAKREAYALAKDHGIRGGVVVFHGYRPTDEAKAAFRGGVQVGKWDPGEDGGIWRWIREHKRHWRDLAYWSPHFHILGVADPESVDPESGRGGHIVPGDTDEDDGWLFKNIRSLDRFHKDRRGGYDDMAGAARYLLSHATFEAEESKQVVTWFGSLAPASFSPEEELTTVAWDKIQEMAEAVVGSRGDRDEEDGGEDDEECGREECEGRLRPIWEAGDFLIQRGEQIEREREKRLTAAFEWAIGEQPPPPGLKHPRTREEAEDALSALL